MEAEVFASVKMQIERTPLRPVLLEQVFSRAGGASLPSGRLHRTPPALSALVALRGDPDRAVSEDEWEAVLHELGVPLDAVRELAAGERKLGRVPVFVFGFAYETVRAHVWAAIAKIEEAGGPAALTYDADAKLFESGHAFHASALLASEATRFLHTPRHYGNAVTFVVPAGGLLGDAEGAAVFSMDAGDGAGWREVGVGEPFEVRYAEFGPHVVMLRDAAGRTARFAIHTAENPFDAAARKCPWRGGERAAIYATIERPGIRKVSAQSYIMRRSDRPAIRKPVVFVEGFPGGYEWMEMFPYINQQNLACRLLEAGYDIVLVRFPYGAERLEANAFALIEVIKEIISLREGKEPLIVGGVSMGGLIARYALAYMERKTNIDHETAKFFTIDTPHEGANMPGSVQGTAQHDAPDGWAAKLLGRDAAKQLLIYWVDPIEWYHDQAFRAHPLRGELLAALSEVESMPKRPRSIVLASGAGDGQQQTVPGKEAVRYSCGAGMRGAKLFTFPRAVGGLMLEIGWVGDKTFFVSKNAAGLDSAPGGVFENPVFQQVADNVPPEYAPNVNVRNACFVPTMSALGIPGHDYFHPVEPSRIPFDRYHWSKEGNRTHAEITPAGANFLLEKFAEP